jgi:hypothetical protein
MVVTIVSSLMFCVVTCVGVPNLSHRFPIVIDMFPINMFRSRYPIILISFSRLPFPFPLPFLAKNTGVGTVRGFSRPFPTVFNPICVAVTQTEKIPLKSDALFNQFPNQLIRSKHSKCRMSSPSFPQIQARLSSNH